MDIAIIEKNLDHTYKRYKTVTVFQKSENKQLKQMLKILNKKNNIRLTWYCYNFYFNWLSFKKYLNILKKNFYKNVFNFFLIYNSIYKKKFILLKKMRFFFSKKKKKKFIFIRFIFGPQQIFAQFFSNNSALTHTHTTLGALIRLRENIRDHGGTYIYRDDEPKEFNNKETKRDKKSRFYYTRKLQLNTVRRILVKKKLIKVGKELTSTLKLRQAKKELLLKKAKKKNKKIESVIIRNKRGNEKTEPLYGKAFRRKLPMWFWFVSCVIAYLKHRPTKVNKKIILSIVGSKKNYKYIITHIINSFKRYKIHFILLRLNLKYNGTKLKHFTTLRKKTKKRILKIEHLKFFKK